MTIGVGACLLLVTFIPPRSSMIDQTRDIHHTINSAPVITNKIEYWTATSYLKLKNCIVYQVKHYTIKYTRYY